MNRPLAVTLLTVLAVVAGILAVVDVLRYLGFLFSPLGFLGSPILGAILAGIVALIWFSVATQLWTLNPSGWMFVVVIAILYLIFDFVAIIGGTPFQALLPSILVSGFALILAILPGTREAFGTTSG